MLSSPCFMAFFLYSSRLPTQSVIPRLFFQASLLNLFKPSHFWLLKAFPLLLFLWELDVPIGTSRKQESGLWTKQVVDDLPNQKTVSSTVSVEVVLDLKGGNAPVTQDHSLIACLIHIILGEHAVSFEWWLLLPFTVQSSLPRRGWQVFLHSTLVETLKKRKKLETSIRTKWTIAWNPSFRWFPETEMSGFGGHQSPVVLVLYIRKGVHAHWGCWRATGAVLHCVFFSVRTIVLPEM